MEETKSASAKIQNYFGELTDPLLNIVVIAVCAVICGADDFYY